MKYWYFRPRDDPRILQQKTAEIETLKERETKLTKQLEDFKNIKEKLHAAE